MAIVDDKTQIEPGLQPGNGNHMRVGQSKNGKTLLQFLEVISVSSDGHADTAKVVGEVQLDNRNLKDLYKLFGDRMKELGITSS